MPRHFSITLPRILAVSGLCAAALTLAVPAGAEPGFSTVQRMPAPVGSTNPPAAPYASVSCPTTTQCTAVGAGGHLAEGGKPTVVTESNGTWGSPQLIAVPTGGVYGGEEPSALEGVSCVDASDCTAVGSYTPTTGGQLPFVTSEVSGTWSTSTSTPLPSNVESNAKGQYVQLSAVQCSSAGNCVAAGDYIGTDVLVHAIAVVQTAGVWGTPVELPDIPDNSLFGSALPSTIACTSSDDCLITGISLDLATFSFTSYAWTETSGTWSAPTKLIGAGGFLSAGVACPDATTCIAVGSIGSTIPIPAAATETSGVWGTAQALPLPALSPSSAAGTFTAVSCNTDTTCEAVGGFGNKSDTLSTAGAATWSDGTWSSIGYAHGVTAAGKPANDSSFVAVSCPSTTSCTGIGGAGIYSPRTDTVAQYSFSTALTPVRAVSNPGAPIDVTGHGVASGIQVRWQPPYGDGGSPVKSYTARIGGHLCHTTGDACTIGGLVNGHRYMAVVTDGTIVGNSPAGISFIVAGTPPRAPGGLRAFSGQRLIAVTWHAAQSPGEAVHSYVVTLVGPRKAVRRCQTRTLNCRFGGLARHTAYVITVVATNASGQSVPSAAVHTRTD